MSAVPSPMPAPVTPEEVETYSTWALTILCSLLIGALWMSYYLQVRKIRAIHETVVSIFAGMVVGLVLRLAPGHLVREMLTFKHTLFFNVLLPPIILNSGYELKQENFFRNFGVILTFAFLGTFISAVGLGVLVYLWSLTGLEGIKLTLIECLIFGSTLSATDPVTILSIFNSYKVDPKLYSIIFGESLINDAVSIVLYETLSKFHGDDVFVSSFFHGVAIFLLQFSISMALGVAFGLVTSLVLKHSHLNLYPGIESCIVTLVAFTSYFLSTGMHMSGVVSLLFCGITLKHYAYHSMSRRTQRTTKYMFSILAQLSENFIFIYLGLNLFAQEIQVFKPLFILVTAISVTAARYAAVFPLSEIINWIFHARGQRHEELPHSYQMMLFWAGLRGAVGVALAVGLTGENADALRTTVLVVVVLTVIIFGGTTARMLEVLGIRVGVEEEDESSDEEGGETWAQAPGAMALQVGPGSRRYAGRTGRGGRASRGVALGGGSLGGGGGYVDDADDSQPPSPVSTPRLGHFRTASTDYNYYGAGQPPRSANATLARGYSAASSSEEDASDDGEAFPIYDGAAGSRPSDPLGAEESGEAPGTAPREGMVFRDGQWFTNLDERYLLPLFTNSVASRRHHAKKASRKATGLSRRESDMHIAGSSSPAYGSGVDLGEAFDEYEEDVASGRQGALLGGLETADIDADSENGKAKGSSSRLKSTFSGSMVDFFNGSNSAAATPPATASYGTPRASLSTTTGAGISRPTSGGAGQSRTG